MGFKDIIIGEHTFELKQLTPILHFQGEQEGATIRASEMKPKLDRFLSEYCADKIREEWIQPISETEEEKQSAAKKKNEKLLSFRYKLRIQVLKSEGFWQDKKKIPGGYFGKLKGNAAIWNGDIKVTITCFNQSLLKLIIEVFPVFIAVTNFGTRQRMGYGCFYLNDREWNREELIKTYIKKLTAEKVLAYYIKYPQGCNKLEFKLEAIKDFHQHLKSGVNYSSQDKLVKQKNMGYEENRSLILKQYHEVNEDSSLINEKKAMKSALSREYDITALTKHGADVNALRKVDLNRTVYKRGLLGFAGQYEFRGVYENRDHRSLDKKGSKVFFQLSTEGKINEDVIEIKRFPSPITYFPEKNGIYMTVRKDYIDLLMSIKPKIIFTPKYAPKLEGKDKNEKPKKSSAPKITMYLPESFDVRRFYEFVRECRIPCCVLRRRDEPIGGFYELRELSVK